MQNNGTNFWSRNNYFWKVPISHIIQYNWKNQLYYGFFSFNLNVKYIQLYNFCLWNYRCHGLACIQASSLKSISVPNVRGDFQFTLPCKVPLWQKRQNDVLCGSMNMDVSPSILKFELFFKNICSTMTAWIHVGLLQSKSEITYLPK